MSAVHRRRFTDELRAEVVRLVEESRGQIAKVAHELGIHDGILSLRSVLKRGTMRITGDRGVCIGAGQCVRWAPELFEQDEELGQIVVLRDAVPDEGPDAERLAEALRNAVRACPSGALTTDTEQ